MLDDLIKHAGAALLLMGAVGIANLLDMKREIYLDRLSRYEQTTPEIRREIRENVNLEFGNYMKENPFAYVSPFGVLVGGCFALSATNKPRNYRNLQN